MNCVLCCIQIFYILIVFENLDILYQITVCLVLVVQLDVGTIKYVSCYGVVKSWLKIVQFEMCGH